MQWTETDKNLIGIASPERERERERGQKRVLLLLPLQIGNLVSAAALTEISFRFAHLLLGSGSLPYMTSAQRKGGEGAESQN